MRSDNRLSAANRAYTLLELLLVIAVVVALMGMTVPAINSLAGSGGRSGAVNILMNTFEQARVAAIEASTGVYVVFADRNHPDEEKRYRAMIVMRDYDPALDPNLPASTKYVPLTKWQFLPKGISLKSVPSSVVNAANMTPLGLDAARDRFLSKGGQLPASLPYVQFSSTGIIGQPGNAAHLQVFIYEGYFDGAQDVATPQSGGSLLDKISFLRFTGRAQLDVTSAPGA